ncbi:hypothetical protein EJ08DRAFT_573016, partial [Tothia fuscella]
YMGAELLVQLFFMFRRKKTLYFWALFVTIWGTLLFTSTFVALMFTNEVSILNLIQNICWIAMTTGFSLVLYSRLHLVNPQKIVLTTSLIVIILNAVVFHGAILSSIIYSMVHPTDAAWKAYVDLSFSEIVFAVQEIALSTSYVYFFFQFTAGSRAEPKTKVILQFLIGVELLVLAADVILNVLLFKEIYMARWMIQSFLVMLKVKVEFMVLNSLVEYSQS